jgi:hypothetical protein
VAVIAVVALFLGAFVGALGTVTFTQVLENRRSFQNWAGAGPVSERLPERLPTLMLFVEERMEAGFTREPTVEVLDDEQFEAALDEPLDGGPQYPEFEDFSSTGFALGLVGDIDRFEAAQEEPWNDHVLGFYDPASDRLVVRGGRHWTPLLETTVIHELVHALQDQQADLDRATRATRVDDDSYLALLAIGEGQAVVVEDAWLTSQGEEYRELHDEGFSSDWNGHTAEPLAEVLAALPYDLGWEAVSQLEESAGRHAALDVLEAPPTTLEQVWDIARWRAGAPDLADAVAVPAPSPLPGGTVVDEGTLGAHLLALLTLEDSDDWFWLEDGPVDGWAGDRYVTWKQRSGEREHICTRITVVLDDADAATTLIEDLTDWARTGGAVVRDGERLDLQRCDTA